FLVFFFSVRAVFVRDVSRFAPVVLVYFPRRVSRLFCLAQLLRLLSVYLRALLVPCPLCRFSPFPSAYFSLSVSSPFLFLFFSFSSSSFPRYFSFCLFLFSFFFASFCLSCTFFPSVV
ncbi:hypothetical protein, partial [Burkholderia pseudomallei]|uniref:hypothetical protein n=1 Tax=Burkholderia pseudomallei TaxID=28450 RepID=UPI0021F7240C